MNESTLYRFVDYNLFSARNIDMPRKVRYAKRKKKTNFKVDKACHIGRTYQDFLALFEEHPDLPVTQMDSYTQEDISLMMDHINSYSRPGLGNKCPYEMMKFLYGENVVRLLGMKRIPPDEVTLNKSVFQKKEDCHA